MEISGALEGQLHAFITSEPDGGKIQLIPRMLYMEEKKLASAGIS
jgi:hypothetical protein